MIGKIMQIENPKYDFKSKTIASLFFISGISGLIYQIVWQRQLYVIYGSQMESIILIVSLFMFGLGLGALLGGALSQRAKNSLLILFLISELGIGCFGLLSIPLIKMVGQYTLQSGYWATSATIFLLLLFPTVLMGATLPILVEYLNKYYDNMSKSVGLLYCVNTMGAASACFITIFFLFRIWGQQEVVIFAACCNFFVGGLVYIIYGKNKTLAHGLEKTPRKQPDSLRPSFDKVSFKSGWLWLTLIALSSYISLSKETMWVRVVCYLMKGHAGSFELVLGLFLMGIAAGSYVVDKKADYYSNNKKHLLAAVVKNFLWAGICFYGCMIAGVNLLVVSAYAGMFFYFISIALSGFFIGSLFPLLCHSYQNSVHVSSGIAVSWCYAASILGSTLGPLVTGLLLTDIMKTEHIILILTFLCFTAVIVLLCVLDREGQKKIVSVVIGLLLLVFFHKPLFADFLPKLHFMDRYDSQQKFSNVIQNRHGIIATVTDPRFKSDTIYGGGVYDGWQNVNPGVSLNRIDRAYLMAWLHSNPADVLEIGMSGGSWGRVIMAYPAVKRLDIVEINPGYIDLVARYTPQKDLLTDPRVHIHVDDGRRWLNRNPDRLYDYILQNTTFYWRSNSTNVLSREYLELCKKHLKAGGIIFINTTGNADVIYTAAHVFKYVIQYERFIAMSNAPIKYPSDQSLERIKQFRFDDEEIDSFIQSYAIDLEKLFRKTSTFEDIRQDIIHRKDLRLVTDDNMATEFKS